MIEFRSAIEEALKAGDQVTALMRATDVVLAVANTEIDASGLKERCSEPEALKALSAVIKQQISVAVALGTLATQVATKSRDQLHADMELARRRIADEDANQLMAWAGQTLQLMESVDDTMLLTVQQLNQAAEVLKQAALQKDVSPEAWRSMDQMLRRIGARRTEA